MPSTFAQNTTVSIEKSRREIEAMLSKYGATKTLFGNDSEAGESIVQFEKNSLRIRFVLKLPSITEKRFDPSRLSRRDSATVRRELWEQGCRQKWRALVLSIKAKFETVENQIGVFETEFLANIVIGDDSRTVSDVVVPQLKYLGRGQQTIGIGFQEVEGGSSCD